MRVDLLQRHCDAVGYVLKYATKSLVNAATCDVDLSTVLLFASNKRLFSMNDLRNRSMLDFHHRVSETSYEMKGSVPICVIDSLCKEMGIELEYFMVINPTEEILHLYGDLFESDFETG